MLPSFIARVLYTRYCALELSTRIFASIQRLARDVHIRSLSCHERMTGTRSPHWQRVAIFRHEFHLQATVDPSTPICEFGAAVAPDFPSPSLIAPWRGATACAAAATTRGPVGAIPPITISSWFRSAEPAHSEPARTAPNRTAVVRSLATRIMTPRCALLREAA